MIKWRELVFIDNGFRIIFSFAYSGTQPGDIYGSVNVNRTLIFQPMSDEGCFIVQIKHHIPQFLKPTPPPPPTPPPQPFPLPMFEYK